MILQLFSNIKLKIVFLDKDKDNNMIQFLDVYLEKKCRKQVNQCVCDGCFCIHLDYTDSVINIQTNYSENLG